MRSLVFEGLTWSAYKAMRERVKKLHKALCRISKKMMGEDPCSGTGKPEQLEHNLSGLWSRRISQKDRLLYKYDDKYIYIFANGGHYEQLQ